MALSDSLGILASPLTIIDRRDDGQDIEAIVNIIGQQEVGQIIAGWPRSLDGSVGQQAEKVNDFVQSLRRRTNVPIELRDERLTTIAAKRLRQISNPKKSRRQGRDDAIAAAIILQGYLDEKTDS